MLESASRFMSKITLSLHFFYEVYKYCKISLEDQDHKIVQCVSAYALPCSLNIIEAGFPFLTNEKHSLWLEFKASSLSSVQMLLYKIGNELAFIFFKSATISKKKETSSVIFILNLARILLKFKNYPFLHIEP